MMIRPTVYLVLATAVDRNNPLGARISALIPTSRLGGVTHISARGGVLRGGWVGVGVGELLDVVARRGRQAAGVCHVSKIVCGGRRETRSKTSQNILLSEGPRLMRTLRQ